MSAVSIAVKKSHPTLPIGVLALLVNVSLPWKRSAGNITAGSTMLNQDFKEFIQSLNDSGARYLVVGGYAVAYHGHPRYTKDLDIWIEMSPENADCILVALQTFGFSDLDLEPSDLLKPDQIIQLGYPPVRIDLLTSLDGVLFNDCYDSRVEAVIDGVQVLFIDLPHLKMNKVATGRHQDLADLEHLD